MHTKTLLYSYRLYLGFPLSENLSCTFDLCEILSALVSVKMTMMSKSTVGTMVNTTQLQTCIMTYRQIVTHIKPHTISTSYSPNHEWCMIISGLVSHGS